MKESWKITILDVVAVITIPLIGVIGYMNNDKQNIFIKGQDVMNVELKEMRKESNAKNIKLENHEGRILNNTSGISKNSGRIDILEGLR